MRPLCSKVNMSDKQEVRVAKGERSIRPWQCRKGAQQQQLQLRLANLPQNLYNLNFPRVLLLLLLPFFFFREYCSYGCWTVRVDLRATTMPLYRRLDFLNFTCFDNEAGMNCRRGLKGGVERRRTNSAFYLSQTRNHSANKFYAKLKELKIPKLLWIVTDLKGIKRNISFHFMIKYSFLYIILPKKNL